MLTAEQLLAKRDHEDVEIDGDVVRVRRLTVGELKQLSGRDDAIIPAEELIAASVCDESFAAILTQEQATALDGGVSEKLLDAIKRLNKFDQNPEDAAKNLSGAEASSSATS